MNMLGVFAPRRFGRLFLSDTKNVSRDPTLIFATLLAIVPAVAFYFGAEAMDRAAFAAFGLEQLSRYVAPVALCLPAFIIGWVTGFLFLEDRDDGPLLALDVTPAGKRGFMAYRISVTMLLAVAVTAVGVPIMIPDVGWPVWTLLAALVALQAVASALVLPALARNKVEGLAITKLTNIAAMAPLLAIFPSPLRYLGGIVPTFWIGELLNLSGKPYLPIAAVAALALASHVAAAAFFYRLSQRRAG
jgi:fluoroquinolone transport system permease protein